jgi:hypothetical protein
LWLAMVGVAPSEMPAATATAAMRSLLFMVYSSIIPAACCPG